jgi:microcystin-dependent protein
MPKIATTNSRQTPIGAIQQFAGEIVDIPPGYMLCDGSTLSVSQYSKLYKVLGRSHGFTGSTFNLPDLRGRFLRGVDKDAAGNPTSPARDPNRDVRTAANAGGVIGNNIGSVQGDAIRNLTGTWPEHFAATSATGAYQNDNINISNQSASGTGGDVRWSFDASRVVPTSTENRPKNINIYYIIKVE